MVWGNKKKKSGSVYFLESTRSNGKTQTYTGSTTRKVSTRVSEHKKSVGTGKSWVGSGTGVKLIGSFPSKNPRKRQEKPMEKKQPDSTTKLSTGVNHRAETEAKIPKAKIKIIGARLPRKNRSDPQPPNNDPRKPPISNMETAALAEKSSNPCRCIK